MGHRAGGAGRRFAPARTVAVCAVLLAVGGSPAYAAERTPAEATAHAREELANAIAQGRVTVTPTPTAIPTSTPTPVPTDQATPEPSVAPTETPLPTTEPQCWQTDDEGNVLFRDDGTPIACLFPDQPADDGLSVEPDATVVLAPPPVDTPVSATPQVVYVVVQQPAAYVPPPTAAPAQVVYVVVTPTPFAPARTSTPTVTPTFTPAPVAPTATALPTAEPVQDDDPAPAPVALVELPDETAPITPVPDVPQRQPWIVPLLGVWMGLRVLDVAPAPRGTRPWY